MLAEKLTEIESIFFFVFVTAGAQELNYSLIKLLISGRANYNMPKYLFVSSSLKRRSTAYLVVQVEINKVKKALAATFFRAAVFQSTR